MTDSSVSPKLRLSLREVSRLVDLSPNAIAALEKCGDFPPRIALPSITGRGSGRKRQFVTREVETWANGGNWRKLVAARRRAGRKA